MTRSLAGLTVVVTRPQHQAGPFIELLRQAGASPVAFPAIAIEPLQLDATARERCRPDDYDWVVFTSANAVEQALAQLPAPRRARIAAVGKATARALRDRGLDVAVVPARTSDSEGLLATPDFDDVRGLRVLILKGIGGRDLLRESLEERGAGVTTCEVYRRRPALPDAVALERLVRAFAAGLPTIAVTSVEVLDALLELAFQAGIGRLKDAPLLMPGERVAAAARERAWRGSLIVAASAEDATMLDALLHRRDAEGPAGPA